MKPSARFAFVLASGVLLAGLSAPRHAAAPPATRETATVPKGLSIRCAYVEASYAASSLKHHVRALAAEALLSGCMTVEVDRTTNAVHLSGSPACLEEAKKLLARIDCLDTVRGRERLAEPVLATHQVAGEKAGEAATALKKLYAVDPLVKLNPIGANAIMVFANPQTHIDIAKWLEAYCPPRFVAELFRLTRLDAAHALQAFQSLHPDRPQWVSLHADPARNALLFKGPEGFVREIREVLKLFGEAPAKGWGGLHILTPEGGKPAAIVGLVRDQLRQLRANPVEVIIPGSTVPRESGQKPAGKLPGNPKATVTLLVIGERLIASCADPEPLRLVRQLVWLHGLATAGECDVIRVPYSDAADVARILDEAFNGKRQQRGEGGINMGALMQRFMGGENTRGADSVPAPREDRIRIFADTLTNSLVINGRPWDLLTVRKLIGPCPGPRGTDERPHRHGH